MLRDSADADHNAGMLNRIVRVKQARADRADFRSLHMLGHRGRANRSSITSMSLFKKRSHGLCVCSTAKLLSAEKLKGPGEVQNAMRRAREKRARFLRTAVVIDDHNLVVRITRLTR